MAEKEKQNTKKDSKETVRKYLERLENEFMDIESEEIIQGLTEEGPADNGLIADKREDDDIGFNFDKNVDYIKIESCQFIDDVSLKDLESVKDTPAGTRVAVKALDPEPGEDYQLTESEMRRIFPADYREKSNLDVAYEDGDLVFTALENGKLVILNSQLYIIKSDVNARCILTVSGDNLELFADFIPPGGLGNDLDPEYVYRLIHEKNVLFGIDNGIIEKTCVKMKETHKPCLKVLVAQGRRPANGTDGKIEYSFDPEDFNNEVQILPDGRVDYRKQASIHMTKKEDIIARIIAPVQGEAGIDIFEREIDFSQGKPAKPLNCGDNVSFYRDRGVYIAEIDGQISLEGDIISVYEHYVVEGDVDFKSGNINFNGSVTVQGNVLPDFTVKATGDIIVKQNVDSGILEAGGTIRVHGGIIGSKNSVIKGSRNLVAHHLQNAKVEILGDVILEDSCIQSEVSCMGMLLLNEGQGVLSGGRVSAFRGVEVKFIGSSKGVKTEVITGRSFLVQEKIKELEKVRDFCTTNLSKIESYLTPLVSLIKADKKSATSDEINRVNEIIAKKKSMVKMRNRVDMQIKKLQVNIKNKDKIYIKVSGVVYPDVTLKIGDHKKFIDTPYKNSSFTLDPEESEFKVSSAV